MLSKDRFVELLMCCERTLYCVSFSILRSDADCQDAVAEAALKAWAARDRFREGADFRPWITGILIRECRNIQRRRMRVLPVAEVRGAEAARFDSRPLNDALAALPEALLTVVTLHYLEGFPVADVASMLRMPQGTVKWRLSKARARLRELLTDDEGVERI